MATNVRVLLVAPDQPDILSVPEIREISSKGNLQTTILNGPVTCQDVFRYCKDRYDILHFVTHGDEDGLVLSDGILLAQDVAQAARVARASIVFMNACDSSELAGYIVSHGVLWSIQGNGKIPEKEAWKIVLAFYSSLDGVKPAQVVAAMKVAFDGTGAYGHTVSLEFLTDVIESSRWSEVQLANWQIAIIAIIATLTTILALLVLARGLW
jgi:hypothetical protein